MSDSRTGDSAPHSIFREDALQRYLRGRQQSVLPRLVSPRTFMCLWILLGLLMAGAGAAWFAKLPVYVSGPAVVVGQPNGMVVVVLLPATNLPRLRAGQQLFLQFPGMAERLDRSIISVEPGISSPESAQRRFVPNASTAALISQPVAVVQTRLDPLPSRLPASTYAGSVGHANVEVGSRRVVSLLPFIGRFFED